MHIVIDTTKEIIALNSIIRIFNDADIDVTIHDIKMYYIDANPKATTACICALSLHHADTPDVLRIEFELFVLEKTHNPTKHDKECKINILNLALMNLDTHTIDRDGSRDIYHMISTSLTTTAYTTTAIAESIIGAFTTNWTQSDS